MIKRLLAAVFALSILFSPLTATAQTTSGLSISPVITEYTLHPGDTKKLTITIKNITSAKVITQCSVNDFESDNLSGNPRIVADSSKQSPNSIRSFTGCPPDQTLDPGQQVNVDVNVRIPSDIKAGAYYGVIRFKAVPAGPGAPAPNAVSLTASVGSILLTTVPGNLKEQAQLKNIHIGKGSREGTFFFGKPDTVGVEIKNLGETFVKPFGTVQIKNTRGKVVESFQLTDLKQPATMLPQSSRTFQNKISKINVPGRYTVSASVAYSNGSNILVMQKSFWYVPRWVAYVLLGLLVVILFLIYYMRRHRHGHYRRHH